MNTAKQQRFVAEYLRCANASEAARRAGYSTRSARSIGAENLTKPDIRDAIQAKLAELDFSAAEVLARLSDQARGSLSMFFRISPEGLIEFDVSSPDAQRHLHLIKRIRVRRRRKIHGEASKAESWEHESLELELHDVQAALIVLGKYHGLFSGQRYPDSTLAVEGLDEMLDKAYGKNKPRKRMGRPRPRGGERQPAAH